MAAEIQHRDDGTGAELYATIRNIANQYWDIVGAAFETLVPGSWNDYDVVMTETPSGGYVHVGTFPATIPAGLYYVDIYEQAESESLITDALLASIKFNWGGSNEIGLADIESSVVAGVPLANVSTSGVAVKGTVDAGTYASTALNDGNYWQISPVAVDGLTVEPKFLLGTSVRASHIVVNGRFDAGPHRYVDCYAYNYITTDWDKLTDTGSRMNNELSDRDYGPWVLLSAHQKAADGEVHLRFRSDSVTVGDDLYLDQVLVYAADSGFTLDDIAQAVSDHDVSTHSDHKSLGFRVSLTMNGNEYLVTASDTATSFTCASLPAVTNSFQYNLIRIHDILNDVYYDSWITSTTSGGVVTLGRALGYVPLVGDELYILDPMVSPSEILASDVDSTGTETVTVAKALEIALAILGGNASYNSTSRVWTIKGRDGTTTLWTLRVSASVNGDRDQSTKA